MASTSLEHNDSSVTTENENNSPSTSFQSESQISPSEPMQLTQEHKDRMEKNRKRALEIRDAKEKGAKMFA
jgi:hypothetical protein